MKRNNIGSGLIVCGLLLSCPQLRSQSQENKTEESLKRELTLEKEYAPMVRDASKIYVLPGVEPPAVTRKQIEYSDWAVPADFPTRLSTLPAAGFHTDYAFSRKRGYIQYGIGNYLNMSGNAGYHILDNEKDRLSVWYKFNSTDGKVKYTDENEKTKQKFYDHQAALSFKHRFRSLYMWLDGDYLHSTFNYYGRSLAESSSNGFGENGLPDFGKNQRIQLYSIRGGVVSRSETDMNYKLLVGYTGYDSRLGLFYGEDGVKENRVTTDLGVSAGFNEDYRVGINARMDNLFYSKSYSGDHNTLIRVNPYFNVQRERLFFQVGLNMDITTNEGTVFRFAPDVKLDWQFVPSFFLYADLNGGKKLNTFADLFRITRYSNPSQRPADTYIPLDATAGLRSNRFQGFWFEIYGGYERLIDDFYFTRINFIVPADRYFQGTPASWYTRSALSTESLNDYCWKYGAVLKYDYAGKAGLSAGIRKNSWKSGSRDFIPYKPDVELDARIWGKWKEFLSVALDYRFMSGLKYENMTDGGRFFWGASGKLKNVSLLNFSANYNFNAMFHVSLDMNNLLNRRYDLWYGMPAQGFNVLVSAGINF